MTLGDYNNSGGGTVPELQAQRRHRCLVVVATVLFLVLTIFIVALILALTVLRPKEPRTEIISVALEGVAPRVSFPAIRVELNVSLNISILVQNRNHATFRHDSGETLLQYRGNQVGDAQLDPGVIPAMGSSTMGCRLTVEADRFGSGSNLMSLLSDITEGQLPMETNTRIPGKMSFLRIFKKHVVSTSYCQIVIGIPNFKIKSQDCKQGIKF
ncbi:hypothetical protein Ancab_014124 [Ancistrocladus abbreviatus]